MSTSIQEFKNELSNYQTPILNYFMGDKEKTATFMSSVMHCMNTVKGLTNCTKESLFDAFIRAAQLRLYPSQASGEAYILPFGREAKFQIGYQGYVTLFYRAGAKSVRSDIIHKNDKFSFINGIIQHEQDIFSNQGEAIGAYVIVVLGTGGEIHFPMTKEKILEIAKMSSAFDTAFTPWKAEKDPNLWMWRKTCIKQVSKLVPKNEELNRAIELDDEGVDFGEIDKKNMLERAKRESEADVTQLLGSSPTPDTSTSLTEEPHE